VLGATEAAEHATRRIVVDATAMAGKGKRGTARTRLSSNTHRRLVTTVHHLSYFPQGS